MPRNSATQTAHVAATASQAVNIRTAGIYAKRAPAPLSVADCRMKIDGMSIGDRRLDSNHQSPICNPSIDNCQSALANYTGIFNTCPGLILSGSES